MYREDVVAKLSWLLGDLEWDTWSLRYVVARWGSCAWPEVPPKVFLEHEVAYYLWLVDELAKIGQQARLVCSVSKRHRLVDHVVGVAVSFLRDHSVLETFQLAWALQSQHFAYLAELCWEKPDFECVVVAFPPGACG